MSTNREKHTSVKTAKAKRREAEGKVLIFILVIALLLYMVPALAFAADNGFLGEEADSTIEEVIEAVEDDEVEDFEDNGIEDAVLSETVEDSTEEEEAAELEVMAEPDAEQLLHLVETDAFFTTLNDAVNAANTNGGGTIEVLSDLLVSSQVNIGSNVTIKSVGGPHTLTLGGNFIVVWADGNLTLGGDDMLTLSASNVFARPIWVYGGTIEVTVGATITVDGDYAAAIYMNGTGGGITVSGGTLQAVGLQASAIKAYSGKVTVNSGILTSSNSQSATIFSEAAEVIVNGGTVLADGANSCAIESDSGTVRVFGGNVSSADYAIFTYGTALVAFLEGTCSGVLQANARSAIVEVKSTLIPSIYDGTQKYLTRQTHAWGTNIGSVVWDLTGGEPLLVFADDDDTVIQTLAWGAINLVEPYAIPDHPVKLIAADGTVKDDFDNYSSAITWAAEQIPAITTYTLVSGDDFTETGNVVIGPGLDVTIIGAGMPTTVTMAANARFTVTGGSLTLGNGDEENIVTLMSGIRVTSGTFVGNQGYALDSSSTALSLEGANTTATINGGSYKGIGPAISTGTSVGTGISVTGGAHVTSISGGYAEGSVDALYVSDSSVGVISGGRFYQSIAYQGLHGHAAFFQNGSTIGAITGGRFEATANCALVVVRGAWVGELAGGTFLASRVGSNQSNQPYKTDLDSDLWNSTVRIEGGSYTIGSTTLSTTGIGTISGGSFSGARFGLLLIGTGARVNTISGGLFKGTVGLQVDRNTDVGTISGGTFDASQGCLNAGRIQEISGGTFRGSGSYGLYNYQLSYWDSEGNYPCGYIARISGGSFTGSSYGITNAGWIETIDDGTFSGSSGISNSNIIDTINGGTFTGTSSGFSNSGTKSIVGTINGGSFTGNELYYGTMGCDNYGTITTINGGSFSGRSAGLRNSLMGGSNVQGVITTINDGRFVSSSGDGILNYGQIDTINNGYFKGYNSAINSNESNKPGSLRVIHNGVFEGNVREAIRLSSALILEPRLTTEDPGNGRYWGNEGVIFENEDLVIYPGTYVMSEETLPVADIASPEFKYLTHYYYSNVFYADGGATGGVDVIDTLNNYRNGSQVTVQMNTWVKAGYHFIGWLADTGEFYDENDIFVMPAHDVTLTAQWEPILVVVETTYTVTYLPGTQGTFEPQMSNGHQYGDDTPEAPETTGNTGWSFTGWSPTVSVIVTADAVYVAQWQENTPPPVVTPPTTDDPEPELNVVEPAIVPALLEYLLDHEISLLGSPDINTWSLVDLILTVLGVLFMLVLAVRLARRTPVEDYEETDSIMAYTYSGKGTDETDATDATDAEAKPKKSAILTLIASIAAILAILLFVLTQDMRLPIVLIDSWTIAFAILFAICSVTSVLAVRNRKENQEDKKDTKTQLVSQIFDNPPEL